MSDYTEVIDYMLIHWPDATIYMQTVPDSVTGVVSTERINGVIRDAVAYYEEQEDTRVKLLDTNSCWGSGCYLPDGAHLTDLGLRTWYEYLAENLPSREYIHREQVMSYAWSSGGSETCSGHMWQNSIGTKRADRDRRDERTGRGKTAPAGRILVKILRQNMT